MLSIAPPPDAEPPAPRPGRLGLPAAFLGAVIAVTLFFAFALWRCERVATTAVQQPAAAVNAVAKAFKDVLQLEPRVTINERVVLNQSSPLLELAVLQREVEVEREMEHSWMGSIKKIRLRGTFRVKAGFDLTQPFSVALSEPIHAPMRISLPAPRILSVEAINTEVLEFQNGLWNRLKATDFSAELAALPDEARRKAFRAGLTREVEQSIVKQLTERFPTPPGVEVTIVNDAPPDYRR